MGPVQVAKVYLFFVKTNDARLTTHDSRRTESGELGFEEDIANYSLYLDFIRFVNIADTPLHSFK